LSCGGDGRVPWQNNGGAADSGGARQGEWLREIRKVEAMRCTRGIGKRRCGGGEFGELAKLVGGERKGKKKKTAMSGT
jgi:hypothetical protein